jgi:hypothetical protein
MDVAACAEALLFLANARLRLAALAGDKEFPDIWSARLAALAFLNDFGKANRNFQNLKGGHVAEAAFFASNADLRRAAGLDSLESWCSDDIEALLAVALAHDGARRDRRLIRPHGLPASDPPDRRRRRLPRGSFRPSRGPSRRSRAIHGGQTYTSAGGRRMGRGGLSIGHRDFLDLQSFLQRPHCLAPLSHWAIAHAVKQGGIRHIRRDLREGKRAITLILLVWRRIFD